MACGTTKLQYENQKSIVPNRNILRRVDIQDYKNGGNKYRNKREYKYLFFMEGFRQLFGLWTLVSYHVSQECRSIRTFARSFLGRHRGHAAICCVWIHLWGNKPFVLRFIASIINVDVMKFSNVLCSYFF